MKKYFRFIMAALMVIGLAACKPEEKPQKEQQKDPVLEDIVITTAAASNITDNSAVLGGEITADGGNTISARGVCWGEVANPNIEGSHLEIGSGKGAFSETITGLKAGATYYVRAYAKCEAGVAYGNEINFTTDDPVISVSDANFQAYLEYVFGDDNGDVHKSVADTITIIDIASQGIKSLEGIKQFPALKMLVANHNPLENIDVAGMVNLEKFDIAFNGVPITNLDLTGCTALTHFWANDPADATGLESFTFELPALQELYLSLWHNIKTLDVTKSPNLRVLSACQMYDLQKLDLTHSKVLNNVWIPDIFNCTELKVASDALDYLGIWNAKVLTSLDLSACPNLRELVANDSYEMAEFKINCPNTLKVLNINCFRKIKSLDLTDYVNLEFIDIIQLYECADIKLPKDLSKLKYMWFADALVVTQLDFVNVGPDARVKGWNCPALKTVNYSSSQEVIGWDYGDNPKEVTNIWQIPGNNIEVFNIDAPNAKKLYISNMHALKTLDLKKCPNVEYICMPDERVMTSIDLSNNSKLKDLWIWANHGITTLDLSQCAMQMNELNVGTGADACAKLQKVILKTGQTITTVSKEDSVSFEYVD